MAALHATAFDGAARWSAASLRTMAADPAAILETARDGFLLGRVAAGEAELLTLVVAPAARRRGTARTLLAAFESGARKRDAATAFLEVSADNAAARALYAGAGWREAGLRRGYYEGVDALILRKHLRPRVNPTDSG